MKRFAILLLAVLLLAGISSAATTPCRASGDRCGSTGDCCVGYCLNNTCVAPGAVCPTPNMSICGLEGERCSNSTQCCGSYVCSNSRCRVAGTQWGFNIPCFDLLTSCQDLGCWIQLIICLILWLLMLLISAAAAYTYYKKRRYKDYVIPVAAAIFLLPVITSFLSHVVLGLAMAIIELAYLINLPSELIHAVVSYKVLDYNGVKSELTKLFRVSSDKDGITKMKYEIVLVEDEEIIVKQEIGELSLTRAELVLEAFSAGSMELMQGTVKPYSEMLEFETEDYRDLNRSYTEPGVVKGEEGLTPAGSTVAPRTFAPPGMPPSAPRSAPSAPSPKPPAEGSKQ